MGSCHVDVHCKRFLEHALVLDARLGDKELSHRSLMIVDKERMMVGGQLKQLLLLLRGIKSRVDWIQVLWCPPQSTKEQQL